MSEHVSIAILGVSNFPVLAPCLASLAMYHGERPLELRLWDESADRQFVALHLARRLCHVAGNFHRLASMPDIPSAVEGASRVLLLSPELDPVWLARLSALGPDHRVLALGGEPAVLGLEAENWPPIPTGDELRFYPHQVLRWIKEDDEPRYLLWQHERSPITDWPNR